MAVVENRSKLLVWALLCFALSLALSAYSARNPGVAQVGVNLVGEVLRPLQYVVVGTSERVTGVWSHYLWLIEVRQDNELMRERVEALEAENSRLREGENELVRLRKLVNAAEERQVEGIAAEVIGYDPSNWVRAITVDKGTLVGIQTGMPVIEGDAVVGQVVAVSPNTSRVLLLTDHSSAIDSLVQATRARGVVHGLGKEFCDLRYVLQEEAVSVGDRIVTSGVDGVFPKGLTVGVVTEVRPSGQGMFQSVRVEPAAKVTKLESVLIVTDGVAHQELPDASVQKEEKVKGAGILKKVGSVVTVVSNAVSASGTSRSAASSRGSLSHAAISEGRNPELTDRKGKLQPASSSSSLSGSRE